MSRTVHEAIVVAVEPLARDIYEWRLRTEPAEALSFRAGQFVSLRVGDDRDGNAVLRSYSIASSPSPDGSFSLIAKLFEGGIASRWLAQLRVGDRVNFTGPMGFFCLDLGAHSGDVVFGVTGVGITPVLPMLDELLRRESEPGRVFLLWGNRDGEDLFWQRELAQLVAAHPRLHARVFLSGSAPAGWSGERGRITQPLTGLLPSLHKPTFYLVGNGAMIRDVKAQLIALGVERKKQIRNEIFYP